MLFRRLVLAGLGVLTLGTLAHADVIDEAANLQNSIDEVSLDVQGERWTPELATKLTTAQKAFAASLQDPQARQIWERAEIPSTSAFDEAEALGALQARLQHVAALEMISRLSAGDVEAAKEWRSVIQLPKYANAVDGALALQRMGGDSTHRDQVARLLAKEYVVWQITRAREKADALARLISQDRAIPSLVAARAADIEELSKIPASLLKLATGNEAKPQQDKEEFIALLSASKQPTPDLAPLLAAWRISLEAGYPNLLSTEDVERRERIVLKLLKLIPMEYQSGVRDGEITIPIEYREAKSFTIQAKQVINELFPVWRQSKPKVLETQGPVLLEKLDQLESAINKRVGFATVESSAKCIAQLLQKEFGLVIKRAGTGADVVTETVLEIRSQLGQSLAAANAKQWRKADQLRADAYVNFDLEIEARTLPRDPTLAMRAEKSFLDGTVTQPGIKAALDARLEGDALTTAYQNALDAMDECAALVKVGLSPTAATISTVLIVGREGLEAVVILAALLAGLRGPENAGIRRRIGVGAWLALAASAGLFAVSKTLLQGLSRYGETLEAIISIIAVIILLMVTNWVFHKYYWTGWNARLRDLSKAAQRQAATRWENLALVGVGFMTIFREGFETTLFMQSLILEAGMKAVSLGLLIGFLIIGGLGFAIFYVGAKLPFRKMLVITGVLVVVVLFTFIGSTVRIFQTVGWMPIHPIPGLELPAWMGLWLGLYPSWEGILFPLGTFAYVGGMWLFVKFTAKKAEKKVATELPQHATA